MLCVVDRGLGGAETLSGYRFSPLFTAGELGLDEG